MQVGKRMKLRKTPIALATLAVFGAVAVGAQTSSITIEAESMALSSYVKENWRIKTTSPKTTGTATQKFSGASGTYDIQVHVVPESDGSSTLEVYKGSSLLRSYQYPLSSSATSFTIGNVALQRGDTLKLVGRAQGGMARIDKMVLKQVAASTPTTTSPTTTSPTTTSPTTTSPTTTSTTTAGAPVAIEAENMALSSYVKENWRIKTTSPKTTGTATQKFSGASGTYDVAVHVVPESDGTSTLDVYKGSSLLRSYQYPLSSSATSFNIGNVAFNTGDTIKLVGRASGGMARVDKIVLTPLATSTPTSPAPDTSYSYSGTPYTGSPIAVPKAVAAVNFDKGGEGVAYHDRSAGNQGNLYRTAEDVDITTSADADGGGYAVRDFSTGEWLAYTLNVPASGTYDLAIKASSSQSTPATFHMEIDGKDVTGPITAPNTGSWNSYKWVGKAGVNLAAGKRILRVVSNQAYFNVNAVSVLANGASAPSPATDYGVYFKSPVAAATLSGQVSSSACEVGGTGITSVRFSVDSTALNTDSSAPWQCSIDTTKLSNGPHTLKAVATYADGTNGTAQVALSVDNSGLTDGGTDPIVGDAIGGIAKPASLLFWTGFEKASVGTPFRCYELGCDQPWTGSTEPTGFAYPPSVFGDGSNNRFQLLTDAGRTLSPTQVLEYMFNETRGVTGRKGTSTRALYSHIAKNGTGSTSPSPSGVNTQNVNMFRPNAEVPEMYISYWLKLPADLATKMKSGTWWQVFEWKTADTDRRMQVAIHSYGGTPYWSTILDQRIEPKIELWRVNNKSVPVPVGKWFKVEVYWKRGGSSTGRIWAAIDGQVIADKSGSNMGPNRSRIDRIFTSLLYSGTSFPIYQWVDDLQMWSTFPRARPGDPWYDAPYASH